MQPKTSLSKKLFVGINFLGKNEHSPGWAHLCSTSVVILMMVKWPGWGRSCEYNIAFFVNCEETVQVRAKLRKHIKLEISFAKFWHPKYSSSFKIVFFVQYWSGQGGFSSNTRGVNGLSHYLVFIFRAIVWKKICLGSYLKLNKDYSKVRTVMQI